MKDKALQMKGYGQAVIHLAWYRNNEIRHLIFGMVELRPTELPHASSCILKSARIGNKGQEYLHYRRFSVTVDAAISWYEVALAGNTALPKDPNHPMQGDGAKLQVAEFVQEPPWPQFVTSNDLVFAPDWMQGSRAHFLFPRKTVPAEVVRSIERQKLRSKLEEWLNFDIVSMYPEYQGALSLVASNPVFREIKKSHVEPPNQGFAESIAYKIVARSGQSLDGLRLEVINERPRGRMKPFVAKFGTEAIAVFNSKTEIDKEGRSITHPEHGLLSWSEPVPLLRTIHVNMAVTSRRKAVHVPSRDRRRLEEIYEVDEVDESGSFVTGDDPKTKSVASRLIEADAARSRRQAAALYDQKWFYDAPAEARHYVRQRIGNARSDVLIVDPYFAGRELLSFGHAIRRPDVQLRILTSALVLDKNGKRVPNVVSGSQLLAELNETFKDYSIKPEIRVLTGTPDIHDRFLVVDGNAWLTGNSLNTIGERAGMIVRIADPTPIIARLDPFWSAAPTLATWLANKKKSFRRTGLITWFRNLIPWTLRR